MLKAFIFDLDGTLVDTLPDLGKAVNFSLEKYNFPSHPIKEYVNFIGNGSKVLIQKALAPNVVSEEKFKEIFDTYLNYYLENVAVDSYPYKGMVEVLNILKQSGYLLFVLTNKPQEAASKLIEKCFPSTFTKVIGNSPLYPTKPNPKGLNHLMEEYHLQPQNVCYLGDSDVDMILADNSNILKKVACLYGYRKEEELIKYNPYLAVREPMEILKILHM